MSYPKVVDKREATEMTFIEFEFASAHSEIQRRAVYAHKMAAEALRAETDNTLGNNSMIPRLTVRDDQDVIWLLAAAEVAQEQALETASKYVAAYAVTGSQRDHESLAEACRDLAGIVGLTFILKSRFDDALAAKKAKADARRYSEETPGYEGPIDRGNPV